MDIDTTTKSELDSIANYIYEKQLEIFSEEFELFYQNLTTRHALFEHNPLIVITGLASEFLVKRCLNNIGFTNVKTYQQLTRTPDQISSSAFAVAGAYYYRNKPPRK